MVRLTEWTGYEWIPVQERQNGKLIGHKDCMERLAAYEDTGLTPEEIKEKMEPKKPQEVLPAYGTGYECMNCGNELSVSAFDGLYCHWCGQRLEWD